MEYLITKQQAIDILSQKRNLLGRGLSYVEKILFLHEAKEAADDLLTRGKNQIKL